MTNFLLLIFRQIDRLTILWYGEVRSHELGEMGITEYVVGRIVP
ncbi:hypothetical protein [Okeania sp. SIO1I7]|nr:hypothetical protein [Okeania sp. SIO1I7]